MLTLKDISTQYGLSEKFLRRCIASMKDELTPFMTRGDRNAMLFKTASSGIFDQIKILKNDGVAIPEIVRAIKKNLPPQHPESQSETLGRNVEQTPEMLGNEVVKSPKTLGRNVGQTPETLGSNDSVKKLFERLIEAKDEKNRIELENKELAFKLSRNQEHVKLLTNGSTDINTFINNNAEAKAKRQLIVEQLKNTSFWMFRKKQRLLNSLEENLS